jgi:endonuclease IV
VGRARLSARAREATCDSFLIFTKSNRQWAAAVDRRRHSPYKNAVAEYADLHPVSVHAAYLINGLARSGAEKSSGLKDEVERPAR